MMIAYPDAEEILAALELLKPERRMMRIHSPKSVILDRELLGLSRQRVE